VRGRRATASRLRNRIAEPSGTYPGASQIGCRGFRSTQEVTRHQVTQRRRFASHQSGFIRIGSDTSLVKAAQASVAKSHRFPESGEQRAPGPAPGKDEAADVPRPGGKRREGSKHASFTRLPMRLFLASAGLQQQERGPKILLAIPADRCPYLIPVASRVN
jgi:hypothetical protein